MSEIRSTRLAEIQDAKTPKNCLVGTIAQLCPAISSQLRHVSTIRPRSIVNFGPLTAEICWWVWGTLQISTGFASWLRYCTDVAQRWSTKLCRMFRRLLRWYTIYAFWGLLPTFCHMQNSLCVHVLLSLILTALLHGTRPPVVSQALWQCTRNGIAGLSQTATPIFGWAAITLGIGPHSRFVHFAAVHTAVQESWNVIAKH